MYRDMLKLVPVWWLWFMAINFIYTLVVFEAMENKFPQGPAGASYLPFAFTVCIIAAIASAVTLVAFYTVRTGIRFLISAIRWHFMSKEQRESYWEQKIRDINPPA